ncbi:hypothetical protein CWI36_0193p0030 [Hamiltosporidium magnivora]|uniref:Uncharacterized protein n=1 Tax=Hamiltosporidium magnivora TaxID=148818 RepID=A0A4Q9LKH6_9MICR|nr:hypothetical protein CWI36_0193p0030 [Hamiltosporidium magnivora]
MSKLYRMYHINIFFIFFLKHICSFVATDISRSRNPTTRQQKANKQKEFAQHIAEKYNIPMNSTKFKPTKRGAEIKNKPDEKSKQKKSVSHLKDQNRKINKFKDKLEDKIDSYNDKQKYFTKKIANKVKEKYSDLKYKGKKFYKKIPKIASF